MTRIPRSGLEALLRETFEPVALGAPMPDGVLDVPARIVRGADARGAVRPWQIVAVVVAAILVTAAALGALGVLPWQRVGDARLIEADVRNLDVTPRVLSNPEIVGFEPGQAVGPVVHVASGNAYGLPFRLLAYQGGGHCLWFSYRAVSGAGGCAGLPQDDGYGGPDLGMTLAERDPGLPGYVYGLVRPGVDRVWIEGAEGTRTDAHVVALDLAGIQAQAYIGFFPTEFRPVRVVLADGAGTGIAAYDFGALMRDAALGGGPSREPSIQLVVRNHTADPVEGKLEDEGPASSGYASGEVPPCDISWVGSGWFRGILYQASVDGMPILDADLDQIEVPSGQSLEVLVDVRPGEEPMLTSIELRPIEDSVSAVSVGRPGEWTGRAAELAAGLECVGPSRAPQDREQFSRPRASMQSHTHRVPFSDDSGAWPPRRRAGQGPGAPGRPPRGRR